MYIIYYGVAGVISARFEARNTLGVRSAVVRLVDSPVYLFIVLVSVLPCVPWFIFPNFAAAFEFDEKKRQKLEYFKKEK